MDGVRRDQSMFTCETERENVSQSESERVRDGHGHYAS